MSGSGNNKRKQNILPEILGIILSVFSTIIDVVFGILSLQFGRINLVIFALSALIPLVIWIWLTVLFYKKEKDKEVIYSCKKTEFIKKCDGKVDIKKAYCVIAENDKKYAIEHKAEIRHYVIITVIFGVVIILNCIMFALQYNATEGTDETGQDVMSNNTSSNENTNSIENTIVNEVDGNKGITPEEKETMENKRFILNDLERLNVLSNEDEERVFYLTMDQDKLDDEVKEHISSIYDQKKRSSFLENSIEERFNALLQTEEDVFLRAIEEAEDYKTQENYEGWKNVIPNSNTLENIIDNRELLLTPSEEDMEFDGVLCIRLANNYQLLADEYKRQGGKPETVIYYYVEAIKRTEDGLAYEDIPKDYKTKYYGYLKARYKDIADYIENNLEKFGAGKEKYQQLMEKANAIYKMM